MLRNIMRVLTVTAICSFFAGNAFAVEPTLHEVYQAAEAGNYGAAQQMMDQVLRAHPNSAKAHFVEAELLAKRNHPAQAQMELETAERLDPGLSFAKPGAAEKLKAQLSAPRSMSSPGVYKSQSPATSNFPWGMLLIGLGLIACVVLVIRKMRQPAAYSSQQAAVMPNSGGAIAPGQPNGPSPTGPAVATGGGIGSGIMGGLATGAAVGVGMVAGEALMHRVLGAHTGSDALAADTGSRERVESQSDMGGNDFGVADAGSWDDNSSTGGGGDDWN